MYAPVQRKITIRFAYLVLKCRQMHDVSKKKFSRFELIFMQNLTHFNRKHYIFERNRTKKKQFELMFDYKCKWTNYFWIYFQFFPSIFVWIAPEPIDNQQYSQNDLYG